MTGKAEVQDALHKMMMSKMDDENVQKELKDFSRLFLFDVPDLETSYVVELKDGEVVRFEEGKPKEKPDITVTANSEVLIGLRKKEITAIGAFASGSLKVNGPFRDLMKFRKLL